MKKTCKRIAVLLLTCAVCGACTMYESETVQSIPPPQSGDTIIVQPWQPNQPEIPPIGN